MRQSDFRAYILYKKKYKPQDLPYARLCAGYKDTKNKLDLAWLWRRLSGKADKKEL